MLWRILGYVIGRLHVLYIVPEYCAWNCRSWRFKRSIKCPQLLLPAGSVTMTTASLTFRDFNEDRKSATCLCSTCARDISNATMIDFLVPPPKFGSNALRNLFHWVVVKRYTRQRVNYHVQIIVWKSYRAFQFRRTQYNASCFSHALMSVCEIRWNRWPLKCTFSLWRRAAS